MKEIYVEPFLDNWSVLEMPDGRVYVGISRAKEEPYKSALEAFDRERLVQEQQE